MMNNQKPLYEYWIVDFQDHSGKWLYYASEKFDRKQDAENEINNSREDDGHWGYPFRFYIARIIKVVEFEEQTIPGIPDPGEDIEAAPSD